MLECLFLAGGAVWGGYGTLGEVAEVDRCRWSLNISSTSSSREHSPFLGLLLREQLCSSSSSCCQGLSCPALPFPPHRTVTSETTRQSDSTSPHDSCRGFCRSDVVHIEALPSAFCDYLYLCLQTSKCKEGISKQNKTPPSW